MFVINKLDDIIFKFQSKKKGFSFLMKNNQLDDLTLKDSRVNFSAADFDSHDKIYQLFLMMMRQPLKLFVLRNLELLSNDLLDYLFGILNHHSKNLNVIFTVATPQSLPPSIFKKFVFLECRAPYAVSDEQLTKKESPTMRQWLLDTIQNLPSRDDKVHFENYGALIDIFFNEASQLTKQHHQAFIKLLDNVLRVNHFSTMTQWEARYLKWSLFTYLRHIRPNHKASAGPQEYRSQKS